MCLSLIYSQGWGLTPPSRHHESYLCMVWVDFKDQTNDMVEFISFFDENLYVMYGHGYYMALYSSTVLGIVFKSYTLSGMAASSPKLPSFLKNV